MNKYFKTIELKQILILASSLLMIPGVFLKLMQVSVKMNFFGMPINKTVTVDYWQNGSGDGKFVLIVAFLTLLIVFLRNYKFIWISLVAYSAVIIYSITDVAINSNKAQNSELGSMFMDIISKPQMTVLPREGALFLMLGIAALIIAAFIKNQEVFDFEKIEGFDINKVDIQNSEEINLDNIEKE